jgi:hypothetical protein
MMPYGKNAISSVNEEMLLENKYYKKYFEQKQKIQERYPKDLWDRPSGAKQSLNHNYENHHLWREYLKELCDLMLKPNGWYQKFVWDTYSQSDKDLMESRSKSNTYGRKDGFNYY